MKFSFFFLLVLVFTINLHAQTDTILLNDVIVNSNRIDLRLSRTAVIDKKQIAQLPGSTPAVWLANIAGVDIRQRGPEGVQSDIGIRGGSFDQTLILLNGMKLSDPQTGHHTLNLPITISAIERIEVIKSSASRIYGINALSGSVNFITKVPEKNLLHFGAYAGDFGLYGFNAGVAFNTRNIGQYFAFSKSASSGYTTNTDFNILQMFYQSTIKLKKSTVNVIGGYTDRSFGARGFYVLNSNEYESIQTAFTGLQHEYKYKRLKVKSQLYYRYNQDQYIYIRSNPNFFKNQHYSHTLSAEVHATIASELGETGFGIDSRLERLNSTNLGKRERNIFGIFAEHHFKLLNKKLHITPGVYVNNYFANDIVLLPGIDILYEMKPQWVLFASVDKGMRLPTFTDLYYNGPSNIGNADLKAEEATSYELGAKYIGKRVFFSSSVFQRVSNNLIDWARVDAAAKWQPLNLNLVTLRGYEGNIHISFKNFIQQLQASYTYMDANATVENSFQSRYALSNIRHQVQGIVKLKWLKSLNQTITVRHINRLGMVDYTLFDSKLNYTYKNLNIYTEVSNILNQDYLEAGFVAMPGRWFKFGVNVELDWKK